jgi:hypothetical protein
MKTKGTTKKGRTAMLITLFTCVLLPLAITATGAYGVWFELSGKAEIQVAAILAAEEGSRR